MDAMVCFNCKKFGEDCSDKLDGYCEDWELDEENTVFLDEDD